MSLIQVKTVSKLQEHCGACEFVVNPTNKMFRDALGESDVMAVGGASLKLETAKRCPPIGKDWDAHMVGVPTDSPLYRCGVRHVIHSVLPDVTQLCPNGSATPEFLEGAADAFFNVLTAFGSLCPKHA